MLINSSAINAIVINGVDADAPTSGSGAAGGRFISSDDLDFILNAPGLAVHARVRIADADGIVQEYSNRDNINWIHSLEYEGNIDAPIGTATVKLWRQVGGRSLAPLKSDSIYFTTGPSIDAGRRITIDTASIAIGATPAEADWHTVFDGYIDDVNWEHNPIQLECRDLGAPLADTWFNAPDILTPVSPDDTIQAVLQTLLDLLQLDTAITLYVPVLPDPAVLLGSFRYDIESGLDPLIRVSQLNGWDLRFRWSDPDQAFRLTYKEPGRDKTTPDFTIGASQYIDVTELKIDRTPIRNDITVWFSNSDDGGNRDSVRDSSPTSVARYGRRSMVLQEASDSPIQKSDAAGLMIQNILFDIAEPYADKSVEMPYFWPLELHNLVRFTANLVHSDTDLDLGVYSYKHTLDPIGNKFRTTFRGRGKPGGSYWQWLTRRPVQAGLNPDGPPGTPPGFSSVNTEVDFAADHVLISWVWGGDPSAVFEVFTQIALSDASFTTGFVSQGTQTSPFDYDMSGTVDIEPFREPPDAPQLGVNFSFYIKARIAGELVGVSKTFTQSYGFGP